MREVQKTVYIADDGTEYETASAALRGDEQHRCQQILQGLQEICWREAGPDEVAAELVKAGYTIVKRGASAGLPQESTSAPPQEGPDHEQ